MNRDQSKNTYIIGVLFVLVVILSFLLVRNARQTRRVITTPTPTPTATATAATSPTVAASPSSQAKYSIGYVGCSNTMQSVEGYHKTSGNKGLLWEPYVTGGMSIEKWANPNNAIWRLYDQQLARYGQPTAVWIQLCEHEDRPVTYDAVKQMIDNLKVHTPNATLYISPLNSYDPNTLCSFLGQDGTDDIVVFTNQAIQDGLAIRGPLLGPLTQSLTVNDRCHPNPRARVQILGPQLQAFFDK